MRIILCFFFKDKIKYTMVKKNITISDLENHFIRQADKGASIDNMLSEFANIIKAKFIKFNYRNPDSYGVIIEKNMLANIYYSHQRCTFGFQCINIDGTIHSVLSLQHSNSSILDLILKLAGNMGQFEDESSDCSSSGSYEDEEDEDESE